MSELDTSKDSQIDIQTFHFDIEDQDQEKRIPRYLISPNSPYKLVWSLLIFILVLYTALILPIRLAFMDMNEVEIGNLIFDCFSDLIFIIDIVINFLSVEEDVNGELIIDRRRLACRYLSKWFWIDLVSSFPVTLIMIAISSAED